MAQLPTEDVGLKQKLDTSDGSLRVKYYDIIKSFSADELKKFKLRKHQYKEMIMNEISESLSGVSRSETENTAQYISNFLANEAQKLYKAKLHSDSRRPNTRLSGRSKSLDSTTQRGGKQNSNITRTEAGSGSG